MSKKFYTKLRQHRIYALIDRELKVAFVGNSYAQDLSSMYYKHASGKNYLTADYFGKEPPKVKPELLILEEVCCTGATAYRHIIAWSLYLEEQGFLMLTQAGTMLYSERLLPETQEIYDCISKQPLEEVMERTSYLKWGVPHKEIVTRESKKAIKPKLSIRVDEQDRDVFMELKRGLNITQREVFHMLLDGVVLADQEGYIPLIRRQKNQIIDLEQEVQELKNQLTAERMNKKHDGRIKEILQHAKTVTGKYVQALMQDVYYLEDAMRPTPKTRNIIHDFPYPAESGYALIQLEEMVYGSNKGMVFVLGWTEDEKPIKLRHYGKREFLGSDPRFSHHAFRPGGIEWEWTILLDTFNNEILAHGVTSTKGSSKPYYHCLDKLKQFMDKREEQTAQVVFHTDQGSIHSSQAFCQAHSHYNILRSMSRVGTPTDNPIIEALNGWMKEELFLNFGLAHAQNVPALLDTYVDFFNNRRPAAALGYKSPVQYKTELGFC